MHEVGRDVGIASADRLRIVGLGGAGCTIVDRVSKEWHSTLATVAVDTDERVLARSLAPTRLGIGTKITKGNGTGGSPDVGRRAAEEDIELLRGLFSDAALVFLVVGLGGGTGTGAAPVLVRMAREAGAMTMCLATLPFQFEARDRSKYAEKGLREMLETADMVIVVPNERFFEATGGNMGLKEAFEKANETVSMGIYTVWKLLTRRGLINIDFADLRNLARNSGGACTLGYGYGTGDRRATAAAKAALGCPMLGENGVTRAEALLVSIIGGSNLMLREIDDVMAEVGSTARKRAHVFMGAAIDDESDGDRLLVTILASEQWKNLESVAGDEGGPLREKKREKKKTIQATQADLDLMPHGKGRFKNIEPTILDGEDLDVPTFIRRGISIEK